MKKLFFTLLFCLLAINAEATNRYVDGNLGSDCSGSTYSIASRNCSGSDGTGHKTAQSASNAAVAGDTVFFRTGTYAGFLVTNNGTSSSPITFKNYTSESPIISGNSGTVTCAGTECTLGVIGKSYITIDGLTIKYGYVPLQVDSGASFVNLLNLDISLGISRAIGVWNVSHDVLIQNVTAHNNVTENTPRGSTTQWGNTFYIGHGSYNVTARQNYLYWNDGEGLVCGDGGYNITLDKNIVADNWSTNLYVDSCQNVTISNNLVYVSDDALNWPVPSVGDYHNNPDNILMTVGDHSASIYPNQNLDHITVINNVTSKGSWGIRRWVFVGGLTDTNFVVANNTVINPVGGIFMDGTFSGIAIKNNIVTGTINTGFNGAAVRLTSNVSGLSISNNMYNTSSQRFIFGATTYNSFSSWASAVGETNSSFADPLLIDTTAACRLWTDISLPAPCTISTMTGNPALSSTSPAINAGTASLASGVTRAFNGSAPDIGAFERFTALNAEVGTVANNKVVLNLTMNLNQPVLITNSTGWSTTCGTISSVATSGNTQLTFTLSGNYGGGGNCAISYTETTGNAKDSTLVGNVYKQRLSGLSSFTVIDNTGGAPGGSVGLSHWRIYLLQGATDTAWIPKCSEDSTNCTVAPGSKLWIRGKLRNNSGSNYASFNLLNKWKYNGGAYAALTDSYVNSIKVLGLGVQLGTVMSDGAATTADLLTSNETTNIAGAVVRSTSSIPTITLNNSTELEFAQAIDLSTGAIAGDTYEMCPFRDDGTALTCATPIKITVGGYQSIR